MPVTHVATITCTGCPASQTSLKDTWNCGGPENWGELSWTDPPKDGNRYREYQQMELCPTCMDAVRAWIAERRAAQTSS